RGTRRPGGRSGRPGPRCAGWCGRPRRSWDTPIPSHIWLKAPIPYVPELLSSPRPSRAKLDPMRIRLSQRADADLLLSENPFALRVGMVLDQQIPLERAFAGPAIIAERIGGDLSPEVIAHYDPEDFAEILARKPAVHRYPASMAKRIRQLAAFIV